MSHAINYSTYRMRLNNKIWSAGQFFVSLILMSVLMIMPISSAFAAATNVNNLSITSTPSVGGYTVGEIVTTTVVFTGTETVTGTPSLLLNIGGNLRTAHYISGSGTTDLVFAYTVVAGDVDANGIAIVVNSLATDGGAINNGPDAATITNNAVADNASHNIAASVAGLDATAPLLRSAVGAGSTITLSYDELGSGLNTVAPPTSDFTFSRNGGAGGQLSITSVSINHTANTVSLGLSGLINLTDTDMAVSYTANGTNDVQDITGNTVADFSNVFVANTMPSFDVRGNAMSFDAPTSILGNGRSLGNKVLYTNVITVDGQSIDAIVTTTTISNITITGYDTLSGTRPGRLDGTPNSVRPLWFELNTNVNTTASGDSYTKIKFDFIKGGTYGTSATSSTGEDVILEHVPINSYDVDYYSNAYQYQEFGGFATYTVSQNTSLLQTQQPGFTRFLNTVNTNVTTGPGTVAGDEVRILALYEAIHTFTLTTGANSSVRANASAFYFLDFSKGPNWANPALTYEIPTVNPKVTDDTTPDLTGIFSGAAIQGGLPSASIQAYTLEVTVDGETYTAGETAGERTTLGNGDIQLLDVTTGLMGVFDPTTGLGTWSLTIPSDKALSSTPNTYDVGVDVGYGTSLATIDKHTNDNTTNELVINGLPADITAPTMTKIERLNPTGENITSAALALQDFVDFKVTFSEPVTNLDVSDFQITGAGSTGSSISSVIQSGSNTYTIRIAGIPSTNLGILDLNLVRLQVDLEAVSASRVREMHTLLGH